jgi:hypothetical protein
MQQYKPERIPILMKKFMHEFYNHLEYPQWKMGHEIHKEMRQCKENANPANIYFVAQHLVEAGYVEAMEGFSQYGRTRSFRKNPEKLLDPKRSWLEVLAETSSRRE